ncbi:MAG: hypothetical protein GC162_03555 [Planctomycetes bacterium]|nr:hypothetical protein [Planctomycetota bacterium]
MNATLSVMTLENFDPPWLWAIVILASVGVLVLTYARMYQRSGKRLAWWLMALRLAAVALLLSALVKPAITHQTRRVHKPAVAIVLDDSQSMGLDHAGRTRYEKAKAWIAASPLGERFDVRLFGMDGRKLDAPPAEPNGEQTNLMRAVEAAEASMRGQGLAGIVLISDGQDTTGRADYMTLADLSEPVYAIGFAAPRRESGGAFDLALLSAEGPARVRVHNAATVQALVRKDGGEATKSTLTIERGGAVLHTQPVDLPAGAITQRVSVTFTPDEPGDFVMTARLATAANEPTGANNMTMFKMRVDAEPMRVLLVEGTLRSELTYLRDRLRQDPDVDLVSFVRSANPDKLAGPGAGALFGNEVISKERLAKIDAVVLGDFEGRMLDVAAYRALREWIDQGGGMIVMGGYRNLSSQGLTGTPLADALPIELGGPVRQIDQAFSFALTPAGMAHPAMVMTGDRATDEAAWRDLPPLLGCAAAGDVKSGATVLAEHAFGGSSPTPVLIEQKFGKGTVMLITADSTWRWSRFARLAGRSDTVYVRFWSQIMRYLAHRDLTTSTVLSIATNEPSYERGRNVMIRVKRNPAAMTPGIAAGETALRLEVRSPDGTATPLKAEPAAGDADAWTASYFPDRGGRFEITARLVTPGVTGEKDAASQVAEFLVRGSKLEMDNPLTNPTSMAQIARVTGGLYADIDNTGELSKMLANLGDEPRVAYEAKTAHLWNHPLVLMMFIAMTSVEWFVRRRNHLA